VTFDLEVTPQTEITVTNPVNVGATNFRCQFVPMWKSHELEPLDSETCGMWRHPVGKCKIIPCLRSAIGQVQSGTLYIQFTARSSRCWKWRQTLRSSWCL